MFYWLYCLSKAHSLRRETGLAPLCLLFPRSPRILLSGELNYKCIFRDRSGPRFWWRRFPVSPSNSHAIPRSMHVL